MKNDKRNDSRWDWPRSPTGLVLYRFLSIYPSLIPVLHDFTIYSSIWCHFLSLDHFRNINLVWTKKQHGSCPHISLPYFCPVCANCVQVPDSVYFSHIHSSTSPCFISRSSRLILYFMVQEETVQKAGRGVRTCLYIFDHSLLFIPSCGTLRIWSAPTSASMLELETNPACACGRASVWV